MLFLSKMNNKIDIRKLSSKTKTVDSSYKGHIRDYLVLRPDQLTLLGLTRLLFIGDIQKNSKVQNSTIWELRARWLLFWSGLLEMILLTFKGPLGVLGWVLEKWLNLHYSNGNSIFILIWNFLSGNLNVPDEKSANYRSIIGLMETRIDLDKAIRPGDRNFNAALSIMAAKLAYENEEFIKHAVRTHWKMEFLEYFNCWNEFEKDYCTQAYMFCNKPVDAELVVVAFCGTKPFNAVQWCIDIDYSCYDIMGMGKVHGGFVKTLGLSKETGLPKHCDQEEGKPIAYYTIRKKLRQVLEKNKNARFLVAGHSLGGALAILFPSILAFHEEEDLLKRLEGVYTFGQPRVGDVEFGAFVKRNLDKKYFRYVYSYDIVPRVPFDDKALLFKHSCDCLYYNVFYRGQVLCDEPNKNYFSLSTLIPKFWLQRLSRIFALVLPGMTPHSSGDYINCTRFSNLMVSIDG